MDTTFLEEYYEKVILPQYKDASIKVASWKDHGQVGPDNWAHYFDDDDGTEYVLLNEDYPGGLYLNDDLTHDAVQVPGGESTALHVTVGDTWIPNVSGYFTLYRERSRVTLR